MNPHGRQFRLGGTLDSWTRLAEPSRRQRAALALAYRGLTPLVYSRYGYRQPLAALPWTRVVVKDPFALLSIPVVHARTGAVPVLLYRHPGAVLASYRRMGWRPDIAEVERLVTLPAAPQVAGVDPLVVDMARFWAALNATALDDLSAVRDAVVVSHSEVATGGMPALRRLFQACGIGWDRDTESRITAAGSEGGSANTSKTLHDLNRSPVEVAQAWRRHVPEPEVAVLEQIAGATLTALEDRRVDLG